MGDLGQKGRGPEAELGKIIGGGGQISEKRGFFGKIFYAIFRRYWGGAKPDFAPLDLALGGHLPPRKTPLEGTPTPQKSGPDRT